MAKGVAIAGGGVCPKCRRKMQRFTHPPGWEPKPGQPYFFLWWDVCRNKPAHRATHVQHYEEAKVHVDAEAPADPLLDHFRSI